MSANVETMFSVVETPWHKMGRILAAAPSTADGIIQAGLNWTVRKEPLYMANGKDVAAVAIVRDTDNAILCDHIGPGFEPLQNVDAFNWFDSFIDSGECQLETAGALANGRRIFILAKLNRQPSQIATNDNVNKYLLLSNSHDGSLAVRCSFTPIRVVCQNTLTAAHTDKESKFLRVFHTANMKNNLEKIRECVNIADAAFEGSAEQYRHLASRGVSTADLRKYFKVVIGKKDDEELSTRAENILEKMVSHYHAGQDAMREVLAGYEVQKQATAAAESSLLDSMLGNFESGRGTEDTRPTNGTYWQAYNAVTEYLTHDRGRNEDSRLNSLWFGDSSKMNAKALQTALTMSA